MKYIFWDMDGVLVDLDKTLIRAANDAVGEQRIDPEVGPVDWYIEKIYGDDVVKEAFLRPDVWINAPAIHKNLEIFMKYYDISYVLSSPCNPVSAACKYVWLENHGIDPQKLILAMNKETISRDGTMLIDDNPKHCVSFMNGGGKSVMFIRPWSNGQSFDKKVIDTAMELSVTSSEELLDAIKSLL